MFDLFSEYNFPYPRQSGFEPGDSCINQLLLIIHETLNDFDKALEAHGIFLDISKAFDKVWYNRLLFKLRQNGINKDIIKILEDFLHNKKQRELLNG